MCRGTWYMVVTVRKSPRVLFSTCLKMSKASGARRITSFTLLLSSLEKKCPGCPSFSYSSSQTFLLCVSSQCLCLRSMWVFPQLAVPVCRQIGSSQENPWIVLGGSLAQWVCPLTIQKSKWWLLPVDVNSICWFSENKMRMIPDKRQRFDGGFLYCDNDPTLFEDERASLR